MRIDKDFPNRLLTTRKKCKYSQTALAEQVGITQRAIVAYEKGKNNPREAILFKLAYALGVTANWLANGDSEPSDNDWDDYTPSLEVRQISLYSIADIERMELNLDPLGFGLHPCSIDVSDNAYAIIISGDAMELNKGLGIPDDSIVIVEPNYRFTNGGFYLIKVENVITFKQLFKDELKTTFRSLNINYADSIYNNNEYQILAKAVYVEINLDK